jgi:hypothetical protein
LLWFSLLYVIAGSGHSITQGLTTRLRCDRPEEKPNDSHSGDRLGFHGKRSEEFGPADQARQNDVSRG